MKSLLSIVLILMFIFPSHAQHSSKEENIKKKDHLIRLGITPSALLNIYPGLQINGTVVLSDNFQFHLEAGRIFFSITSDEDAVSGFRLRPGFRFYFSEEGNVQFHASLALNYRKTSSDRIGNFNVTGIPTTVITKFQQGRITKGLASMFGVDYWVADNFILDMGLGVGLNKLVVEDLDIPNNSSREFSTWIKYDSPGEYDVPLFILNIRIQYLF